MARPATNPAARLERLRKALPRAQAFAKANRGGTLTAKPMSEMLGVSWPVLRDDWCDGIPDFEDKCFTRGGNGIEWAFKPVATVRFLIKHFEAEQAKRLKKAKQVRRAVGGDALDHVPEDMDLDQIGKLIKLGRELREEQVLQGQLVKRVDVANLLAKTFSEMLQAGVQAGREMDPTGQWPTEYAEAWQSAIDNLILSQSATAEECLSELGGGSA